MAKKRKVNLLPIIYLIFGLYFLNLGFGYLAVPEFLLKFSKYVNILAGVVFLIAFYRIIMYSKKRIIHQIAKASK